MADNKWQLKKDSEGIKIYTSTVAGSDVKALKAEFYDGRKCYAACESVAGYRFAERLGVEY
jgi:hypothetical protein